MNKYAHLVNRAAGKLFEKERCSNRRPSYLQKHAVFLGDGPSKYTYFGIAYDNDEDVVNQGYIHI